MNINTIKVYGSGVELTWGEISAKLAKKIINSGVSETQKDELISESENGIISDISIKVNDKSINFDIKNLEKKVSLKEFKSGSPKKWYLLETLDLNGLFYESSFDTPFDSKKISLVKEKYTIGSVPVDSIFHSISYDGQEKKDDFDFSQRKFTGVSYFVLSPKNEVFEVQINDDEEDDGDDEDLSVDTKIECLEIHCENSLTADNLIAELSTWGSLYHKIKIDKSSSPNSKVLLKITGIKDILIGVDTVTNQSEIQSLGRYTKKFSE
jgi:hypothetical protein